MSFIIGWSWTTGCSRTSRAQGKYKYGCLCVELLQTVFLSVVEKAIFMPSTLWLLLQLCPALWWQNMMLRTQSRRRWTGLLAGFMVSKYLSSSTGRLSFEGWNVNCRFFFIFFFWYRHSLQSFWNRVTDIFWNVCFSTRVNQDQEVNQEYQAKRAQQEREKWGHRYESPAYS